MWFSMTVTENKRQERIMCVYELMNHFLKYPTKKSTYMELMDDNFPLFNKDDASIYEHVRDILLSLDN